MTQTVFPQLYQPLPLAIRAKVLKRDRQRCQVCDIYFSEEKLDVHHKIPVRKGGTHAIDNLITVCRACHKKLEPPRSQGYAYRVNQQYRSIKIKDSTYDYLMSQGRFRETWDDIIVRLANIPNKEVQQRQ
jgi:hypothetical protein